MARSKILVVDDERMIRWSIQQAFSKDGHSVAAVETGEEALSQAADDMPDLVFLDITLPGIDGLEVLKRLKAMDASATVVMVTATEDLKTAVEAMRLGAYDFISKPFDIDRLRLVAQNALDRHELREEVEFHRKESIRRYGFHRIIGSSREIRDVLEVARKVARSEATTVLLQGESGTGKDLLAQAIHYESHRSTRPFMPINCTALPDELLESELMGHEKGAFTDAKASKKGLFEVADGGTVFLDEIGDMKPGLQSKLLRFLETKTFRRVGGHRDIVVDVRIVTATNKNLDALVRSGAFREDLFFRLNVVPIFIPPLRDRREDILPLADFFLSEFSREFKRPVTPIPAGIRESYQAYSWPGNVRELRNAIERAIILGNYDLPRREARLPSETAVFPPSDVADAAFARPPAAPAEGRGGGAEDAASGGGHAPGGGPDEGAPAKRYPFILPERGVDIEDVERDFIEQALDTTSGNQTRAAELLGLTRDALRYRMKKFGLQ